MLNGPYFLHTFLCSCSLTQYYSHQSVEKTIGFNYNIWIYIYRYKFNNENIKFETIYIETYHQGFITEFNKNKWYLIDSQLHQWNDKSRLFIDF